MRDEEAGRKEQERIGAGVCQRNGDRLFETQARDAAAVRRSVWAAYTVGTAGMEALQRRREAGNSTEETRDKRRQEAQGEASVGGTQVDKGQAVGAVEAALWVMDAGSGKGVDRTSLRGKIKSVAGREIFEAVGLYAAEADAQGV